MTPPQPVKSPRAEAPQPDAPLAVEQGEHLGRSPDLRVNAWPGLPAALRCSGIFRPRSPLTVAGAVVEYVPRARHRTTFPFNHMANCQNQSPFVLAKVNGNVKGLRKMLAGKNCRF